MNDSIEVIGAGFVFGIPGIWANHTIPASSPEPEPTHQPEQPTPPSPEPPQQEEQPQEVSPAPSETTGE